MCPCFREPHTQTGRRFLQKPEDGARSSQMPMSNPNKRLSFQTLTANAQRRANALIIR